MPKVDIDKFCLKYFYRDLIPEILPFNTHRNDFRLKLLNTVTSSLNRIENTSQLYAAGGSLSSKKSLLSSVGESIERTSLNIPPDNLFYGSYEQIENSAIDPQTLYGFTNEVYTNPKLNITNYHPRAETIWYKCRNIMSGAMKYIPACNIWKNIDYKYAQIPIWDRPVSTGASSHYNSTQILLSGILEVIERDTFTLYWENNISGIHVQLPKKVEDLQFYLQQKNLHAQVIKLPNEFGIPVACCNIKDNTGYGPLTAFGAAAKLTWEDAAERALEEAMLTTIWLKARMREEDKPYDSLISLLSGIPDPVVHADIYATHKLEEHYESLFDEYNLYKGKYTNDFIADGKQLIERIVSKGYEIYTADITLPEFKDIGYKVMRIIIPKLVPLSRGFFLRHSMNARHAKILNDCVIKNYSQKDYFVHPLP